MTFLKSARTRMWLGYLAGLLIIGFLFLALRKDWGAIRGATALLRPETILISMAAGLAASVLSAWSWHRALRALGAECTFRQASHVWYTSMAARYVPGTIPGVALRIYLATRIGLSRPVAATATALDWVCWLVSALLAAVLTAPWWARGGSIFGPSVGPTLQVLILALALGAGLLVLHPACMGFLLRKAARKAETSPSGSAAAPSQDAGAANSRAAVAATAPALTYRQALVLLPVYLLKWPCYGLSVAVFLASAGTKHGSWPLHLPAATAAFAVGWTAGFVSPFAPGGIGVREGVIVGVMHGLGSGGLLLEAALLSRFANTLAEILCWIWAVVDERMKKTQKEGPR